MDDPSSRPATDVDVTFVPEAQPGCHVLTAGSSWWIGRERFLPKKFGLGPRDAVPDLSVDPREHTLSVLNPAAARKSFFVTAFHKALDRHRQPLTMGTTRSADGTAEECVTFVVVVEPKQVVDLCYLQLSKQDMKQRRVRVTSDVQEVEPHPDPDAFDAARTYPFPLAGQGPWQCTQGFGGEFTHLFAGTYHAVDFACPVGTPILAVGDGVCTQMQDHNAVGGIAVDNLFHWNSVMLRLDDGTFVEYVHLQRGSAKVAVGDRVARGQPIALSGDVGFCPTPHLHLQMHASDDPAAPTVKFALRAPDGSPYFPRAGEWYRGADPGPG